MVVLYNLKCGIKSGVPLHTVISQVSFKSPQYFQRYAPDKPIITKLRKGNNSVITCDRATIAFTLSLIALYQMYQVSFDSLLYFKRYATDKLIIAKIKTETL